MNPNSSSATLPRRLALTCLVILGISAFTVAAPEDFYREHLPLGVKMGMSLEELAKARPALLNSDLSPFNRSAPASPPGAPVQMLEQRVFERGFMSGYRFKEGKLRAVTEGTGLVAMTLAEAQAAVSKLAGELEASFVLKRLDKITRKGGVEGAALITAQLWEDKASGLQLYFVATTEAMELCIFDPRMFGKADFFLGPEMLEKVQAGMELIRRQGGDRADPPMALIDLLATPATEKK